MGRNRKPNLKVPKPQVVYTKVAEPVPQILVRLAGKGLTIDDPQKTEQALKSIGYYRLLIYMRHFQTGAAPRNFLPGAVFSHITELYAFDRAVRLLTLDAIERLEVALRAAIINPLAELHGPHWYLDMSHYASEVGFHGVLGKIIQGAGTRRGLALSHYYDKYSSPSLPPIWLVCEKLTFGALSRFFAELKIDRRKKVARYLWTYPENLLVSWFHSLADLRNICAHQDRLWNNPITTYPPERHHSYAQDFAGKNTFYSRAVVIQLLMKELDMNGWWRSELGRVLAQCGHVEPLKHLGFPVSWEQRPVWV